ncbi:unnamed protein product [Dicrocoelium dendriticum]|nr:unnamed protein product [Dicrocoelium dendriticum]
MIVAVIQDDVLQTGSGSESQKRIIDEVKLACKRARAQLHVVPFEGVALGKADNLDPVYNSDVLILDLSVKTQQGVLLYHLGVRENMKLLDNIVLIDFVSSKSIEEITRFLGQDTKVIPYALTKAGTLVSLDVSVVQSDLWEDANLRDKLYMHQCLLCDEIFSVLCETRSSNRAPMKEKFLADLRSDRERYKGSELQKRLRIMRRRLDDSELLSPDILLNMLLSYRECEDFSAMVKLIDDVRALKIQPDVMESSMFTYLYAYALNGRKEEGDREKSLQVITELLETCKQPSADMFGLLGRIHKDRFLESNCEDQQALNAAVESYRRGFESDPNEYLGVNLATLLVCKGLELNSSPELRDICNMLNRQIGRKGDITKLTDYWDLATLFEIRVLSENYTGAVVVLERMFNMDPPAWQLHSTMRNIRLICQFRKPPPANTRQYQSRKLFDFWMEFLSSVDSSETPDGVGKLKKVTPTYSNNRDPSDYRTEFPVLAMATNTDRWEPAFLSVNIEQEPKYLRMCFFDRTGLDLAQPSPTASPGEESLRIIGSGIPIDDDQVFHVADIKGICLANRYPRHAYLFTTFFSRDYSLKFSCESVRLQFYSVVSDQLLSSDQLGDLVLQDEPPAPIEFEYENEKREILGKGAFGTVYVGRDLATQRKIAIKELSFTEPAQHQQMLEEIRLHSRLNHENIVHYLGAVVDGGVFKVLMELVPGGSLTSLLKKHEALQEKTVSNYSMQILKGLNYLHRNRIIHRDIKADNILINQYTGVLKLSDFGVSKRLTGMGARAVSFKGTCQYMAPELIKNQRGYDFPIDIWSFGCTVVQMLTGFPPFKEYENPMAAVFRVGRDAEHPAIPDSVSPICRAFVLRTFVPTPSERATAAELLDDPFIELYNPKRKHGRPAASYGHTPSQRPPLNHDFGGSFQRFLSSNFSVNVNASSVTGRPPTPARLDAKFNADSEHPLSGFISPLPIEVQKSADSMETRRSPVPFQMDGNGDGVLLPAGCKRDRFAVDRGSLPRLKLRSRPPLDGANLKLSSESLVHSSSSDLTTSISTTPETFKYVKKDKESKSSLRDALDTQRQVILTAWHTIIVKSGTRLPPHGGGSSNSVRSGNMEGEFPQDPSHHSSRNHSQDSLELEVLECLFDMLLDNLQGGSAWNDIAKHLTRTSSVTERSTAARSPEHQQDALGERFENIIRKLTEHDYREEVSLFTSSWLFTFLNSALDKMWKSFERPLCGQLQSPHELLAWHKFIRDAAVFALEQLNSINVYEAIDTRRTRDAPLSSTRAVLRRNRTFAAHGGSGASRHSQARASRSGSQYAPTFPTRAVRPATMTLQSFDEEEDDAQSYSYPTESAADTETLRRRHISFKTSRSDARSAVYDPVLPVDEPVAIPVEPVGAIVSSTTAAQLVEAVEVENEEEVYALRAKLARLVSELTDLLRADIRHKEAEIDRLRECNHSVGFHGVELSTGHPSLRDWFSSMNLSTTDVNILLKTVKDESDFLSMVTKDDLYRLNLSFPAVLRVWRAVVRIRESHRKLSMQKL